MERRGQIEVCLEENVPLLVLFWGDVGPHAADAAEMLQDAGLTVIVYTLNRADLWQQALDLGVDGVVTDAPRRLASVHAEAARGS